VRAPARTATPVARHSGPARDLRRVGAERPDLLHRLPSGAASDHQSQPTPRAPRSPMPPGEFPAPCAAPTGRRTAHTRPARSPWRRTKGVGTPQGTTPTFHRSTPTSRMKPVRRRGRWHSTGRPAGRSARGTRGVEGTDAASIELGPQLEDEVVHRRDRRASPSAGGVKAAPTTRPGRRRPPAGREVSHATPPECEPRRPPGAIDREPDSAGISSGRFDWQADPPPGLAR